MSANPHNPNRGLRNTDLREGDLRDSVARENDLLEPGLLDHDPADHDLPGNQLLDSALIGKSSQDSAAVDHVPGHEALQALLAFSSLHEQLRQRRALEKSGVPLDADVWQLEQFVLDEVLQLVAERALTLTGADGIAIAMAEGDAIVCRAIAGTIAPEPGARLDPKSGFSGACLRTGGIVRCDDSENDSRVNVQVCRRLGTRSIVAVPIASAHGTIGLLEAFSAEPHGFNDSDVRSLKLLAELILSALRPEEENRLAEISQRLVAGETVETPLRRIRNQELVAPEEVFRARGTADWSGNFSGVRKETEFHRRPCSDCSTGCACSRFGRWSVVEVPSLPDHKASRRPQRLQHLPQCLRPSRSNRNRRHLYLPPKTKRPRVQTKSNLDGPW